MDLSGVAKYADLDAMLAEAKLDMVDICLPTASHAPAAIAALAAGKHVLLREADRPEAGGRNCHGRSGRSERAAC